MIEALEVNIEDLSEESFSLENSITRSKEILSILKTRKILAKGEFEDDVWSFNHNLTKGHYFNFNFNKIKYLKYSHLPDEIEIVLKCWIAELLDLYYPSTVTSYYRRIIYVLEKSDGFNPNYVDILVEDLQRMDKSDAEKSYFFGAIFNFFDYLDLEASALFIPKLMMLRRKLRLKSTIRKLPPSKEILKFSYYLEVFFNTSNIENLSEEKLHILYYPLFLWWSLTTIIPIRPTEFCLMRRDCAKEEDGIYKISIPRIKHTNKKRIQKFDTIEIQKEMYELILKYIEETDLFGTSETLISYRSLIWADNLAGQSRITNKNVIDYFSTTILKGLIIRFYHEVIYLKYHCLIDNIHFLRPNDTRHLAFISLMMQGFSPIEIARLGGHQTIAAQYHYQQHTEYWIDSEVFKLMKKYKVMETQEHGVSLSRQVIPSDIKTMAFKPALTPTRIELKIGYCTDELQRCQTHECILCPSWRITPEELIKKEKLIAQKYEQSRKKTDELIAFLQNLHRVFLADDLARRDAQSFIEMKRTAMQIKEEIQVFTRVNTVLQKGINIDAQP